MDALGYFESTDLAGYLYPSELVRRSTDPSSEEDEPAWDPDREEEEADEDDVEDGAADADEETYDVSPPVLLQSQDLER